MHGLGESFLRPANTDDVSRKLIKNVFGLLLEGITPHEGAMHDLSQALGQTLGPDNLRRA